MRTETGSWRLVLAGTLSLMSACAAWPPEAGAAGTQAFRVENEVFADGRREPVSSSTTVFHDGLAYDFLREPQEVIVLDKAHDRLVLLNLERRVKTELTTREVSAFTERLREWARAQEDDFLRFSAEPSFEERFDESTGELTLASSWLTYRLKLSEAAPSEVVAQYREFCDWTVQLNSILSPKARPPFARLIVNEKLAEREATAREVELTINWPRSFPPRRSVLRSEHRLTAQVGDADLNRVAQTRQFMEIFQLVSFDEYRRGKP